MGLTITHRFVSAKADSSDPTLIQPSNWNDQHVITNTGGTVNSSDYNFTLQAPPESLSSVLKTVTLIPVPLGVNGSNLNYLVGIYNNAGVWQENAIVNGGTAVSDATSGTLTFSSITGTYVAGTYKIGSVSGGILEAMWDLPSTGGRVNLPSGLITIYTKIKRRAGVPCFIVGQGMGVSIIDVPSNFVNSGLGVLDWSSGDAKGYCEGGGRDFNISFYQPDSANLADYIHWIPAIYNVGTYHNDWRRIEIIKAWVGVKMNASTIGAQFVDMHGSCFNRDFDLDGANDTVRIVNYSGTTTGLNSTNYVNAYFTVTAPAFYIGHMDDLKIIGCTVGKLNALDAHPGGDGVGPTIDIKGLWCDQGGLIVAAGSVMIDGIRMASAATFAMALHTGGNLFINNFWFLYVGTSNAMYSGPTRDTINGGPMFILSNGYVNHGASGSSIALYATSAAPFVGVHNIKLSNIYFDRPSTLGNACVLIDGGTGDNRLTMSNCTFSDKVVGTGAAVALSVDTWHTLTGNNFGGWGVTLAGTTKLLMDNVNVASNVRYAHAATRVYNKFSPNSLVSLTTENYIASETGANNALAGALVDAAGVDVPLAAGLKVTVLLAHTTQIGANTLALNGGTAKSVKRATNPASDLDVAFVVGSLLTMIYDGIVWQCTSR